jgi:hypothetical protein
VPYRGGGSFSENLTWFLRVASEHNDSIRDRGNKIEVVARHQDYMAPRAQPSYHGCESAPPLRIEPGRRLIEEQRTRRLGKERCERDAALLPLAECKRNT